MTAKLSSVHLLRRAAGVVALIAVALVHVVDAPSKFSETPYLGWGYLALVVGCLVAAVGIASRDDRRAWTVAGVLCAGAFVAYCLSRTIGLPNATDDIGNWFEPLGVATLVAEAAAVGVSLWSWVRRPLPIPVRV